MRVLAVKRISRDTEDSSALERQTQQLTSAIAQRDVKVAGWVEDSTVSGSVNLDERPSLGKWMVEPLVHEWDALMVTEQDRITRDDMHWWSFVGWVLKNNKTVIILDDPSFDLSTEDGRMIAGIKATQAAKYRKAVQEKKRNQTQYYRDEGLWSGGSVPFGYRPVRVEHNGRQRWKLEVDPVTSALVREAYDRLVNHGHKKSNTMGAICRDWNERGILTSKDYQSYLYALEGRTDVKATIRGTKWATSTLKSVLSNKALMGYAKHKGDVLLRDGLPVKWADEILTPSEFDELQRAIAERGKHRAGIKGNTKPIVGVVYCMCGQPLYSNVSHKRYATYNYMICKTRHFTPCEYVTSWPIEILEEMLENSLLTVAGHLEVTTRKYIPGTDRTSEITVLREAVDNLTQAIAMAKSPTAIEALSRSLEEHSRNLERLESEPVIPGRWEEEGTGETYRDMWNRLDWEQRGDMLRGSGIRLYVAGTPDEPRTGLSLPKNLARRTGDVLSGNVRADTLREDEELSESFRNFYLNLDRPGQWVKVGTVRVTEDDQEQ